MHRGEESAIGAVQRFSALRDDPFLELDHLVEGKRRYPEIVVVELLDDPNRAVDAGTAKIAAAAAAPAGGIITTKVEVYRVRRDWVSALCLAHGVEVLNCLLCRVFV